MTAKKAQIEMIGLVIVVIILAIGLLLYVKLAVFRDQGEKENTIVENAYLTNLMGAVFNVKVCETDAKKVEEVLVMCFENQEFCSETDSCIYLKKQIKEIITSVGIKDFKKYSISVEKGDEKINVLEECKTGINTHTTLVTGEGKHYTTNFMVC